MEWAQAYYYWLMVNCLRQPMQCDGPMCGNNIIDSTRCASFILVAGYGWWDLFLMCSLGTYYDFLVRWFGRAIIVVGVKVRYRRYDSTKVR
jgi:hypothetical protein